MSDDTNLFDLFDDIATIGDDDTGESSDDDSSLGNLLDDRDQEGASTRANTEKPATDTPDADDTAKNADTQQSLDNLVAKLPEHWRVALGAVVEALLTDREDKPHA